MSKHYSQKDNLISIMTEISKKTPRGIVNGDTMVGHITWQMYLMRDYLKLDGTPLANASNDYSDLLSFAQDNNLITSDTTDNSLFKYNSTTDVLTLPNYIDLVLQGGNTVEEKEAGLPNIKGVFSIKQFGIYDTDGSLFTTSSGVSSTIISTTSSGNVNNLSLDASRYNSIYSDSINTVQPPAITLIPQIKYRKATTMYEQIDAVVNYSTTEKVIGTWIDGKPLYQKTIQVTTPSTANSYLPVYEFTEFEPDIVISIEGYDILNSGDGRAVTYINSIRPSNNNDDYIWAYYREMTDTNNSSIKMQVGTAHVNKSATLTIRYTKKTD